MINLTKSKMNQLTYQDWVRYFRRNDTQRLAIDFSQEKELSQREKDLIFPSIQAFQKGEGSDGFYLMKTVEAFVEQSGETDYREAMQMFIREENWHSAYLRKYIDFYGVNPGKKSFLDSVFRRLRQLGGLKCEITILVTAEIIALTYYTALSKCTDSPALKSICEQMLHDELPHIMFQSYTLSHFKAQAIDKLARKMIMTITSLFVWCAFHDVFQKGGYGFRRFMKENLGYLRQSIHLAEQ